MGNTMCFRPGVHWGMGAVLHFDTRTLTITSRGFYVMFGHTPDGVRNLISYPLGAGGHSTLTVYVGLEQMFYDINDKVYMYELIDNLSTHFSVANNTHSVSGMGRALASKMREASWKKVAAQTEASRMRGHHKRGNITNEPCSYFWQGVWMR